jgi:hypothetical protein
MRHYRTALTLVWLAGAALAAPGRGTPGDFEIVFTMAPAARAGAGFGEGGHLMRLARGGSLRPLTPQFASAADPAVSFDGRRILFAGKKSATDRWNIYEMTSDGSNLRQITHDLGDCRSPIYQSPIFYLDDRGPMPQIAFVSWASGSAAIYSARMDGSGVRRLTYNPAGALDPVMLPDGRLLFSGGERESASRGVRGSAALAAVNIDGTDYATFSGAQGRRIKRMACVTAKRLVLFVDADVRTWDGAGPLAAIDLRRNLHSYRRLPLSPAYLYHSPSPLPDGTALVSRRPAEGGGTHSIVRLDPQTGRIEAVFSRPGVDAIQAQALVARPVPDGRSSVVDEKQAWAKLYCLNLYETDLNSRLWPHGLVKRIRLLEALPQTAPAGLSKLIPKRLLGETEVDADGSFHLRIPANLPVQIQALDENGMALRTSAWMWAKNKEQRGCIGCHEDGERTPENVMASALMRPAADLMLAPERRRTVDFERDVVPVLARRCVNCHAGNTLPKFAGSAAYETLLRYVTPGAARTSALVWALFGRNTSRPWDPPGPGTPAKRMPPAGSPPLTAMEKLAIIEWIDLGAHYGGAPKPAAAGGQR